VDESDSSSLAPREPLGFYLQAAIGLVCGLAMAVLAWFTALWWPGAGIKIWIIVFVVAWIVIFQLVRSQRNRIIVGLLIGTIGGYLIMGIVFNFSKLVEQ